MAEASFGRSTELAQALFNEAPFDRGFDMRASLNLKGEEYAEAYRFEPLADKILPISWDKAAECNRIARDAFSKAIATIQEHAPELITA